jgi:hypothetical protein
MPATDNKGVVSSAYISTPAGYVNGSSFPVGTTLVKYVVGDAAGNQAFCSLTVQVYDNQVSLLVLSIILSAP